VVSMAACRHSKNGRLERSLHPAWITFFNRHLTDRKLILSHASTFAGPIFAASLMIHAVSTKVQTTTLYSQGEAGTEASAATVTVVVFPDHGDDALTEGEKRPLRPQARRPLPRLRLHYPTRKHPSRDALPLLYRSLPL